MFGKVLGFLWLPIAFVAHAEDELIQIKHFSDDEIATIEMPVTAFQETPADVQDYSKYFYFYRADTSFDQAYSDIAECDARARGTWQGRSSPNGQRLATQYGIVGAALQSAIFAPAQNHLFRRANLRRCMFFKGYQRYGLSKALWEAFNFQNIDKDLTENVFQHSLLQQALLATGPKPAGRELGL